MDGWWDFFLVVGDLMHGDGVLGGLGGWWDFFLVIGGFDAR